jgi:hypothetical protein
MMELLHILKSLLHEVWQNDASFTVSFFKRLGCSVSVSRAALFGDAASVMSTANHPATAR